MSLELLEIPDDVLHWPGWLERQLVGLHLRDLVTQLKLISDNRPSPTIEEVCGEQLEQLFQNGLVVLSARQIGRLLEHPDLLLELQERVLLEGSSYWQQVPRSDEHLALVESQRLNIEVNLQASANHTTLRKTPDDVYKSLTTRVPRRTWHILAVAALLMLVLGVTWLRMQRTPWGFERQDVLAAKVTDGAYFTLLAEAAGEWFLKRPEDTPALVRRLKDYERGCQTLSASTLTQLSRPDDRSFLIAKCGDWLTKIRSFRSDLESGTKTFEQVLTETDEAIRNMQSALRDRAALTG